MVRFTLIWLFVLTLVADLKAENIISENVVIETDRDIYIAGEDLYFGVFVNSGHRNTEPVSKICYLVLRNEKNTILKFYVKINNSGTQSSFYLPDTLKTGYYEIVAFTNSMRNFGEEAYSRKQLIIVNRFDEWLEELKSQNTSGKENDINIRDNKHSGVYIKTIKDTFGIREKVDLEIESNQHLSNISITVKELNPLSLLLLKQQAAFPALPINEGEMKYKTETNGIHLYGKLTNGNIPVENECLFISTPDSFPNLQYTFTNKDGEFIFTLGDYYPGKPLIITTRENNQGNYHISIDDKFELSQPFIPRNKTFDAEMRQYIRESQNIVKVLKAYNINYSLKETHFYKPHIIPYVYHEPTAVVFPSQFVVLNNFEEIVNNLLTGFRVKSKDGLISGYNMNPATGLLFESPSAIFLNGVYVYNLNSIMNFTTPDINKIELCNEYRLKGKIQFSGIISVNTPKKIDYAAILPGSLVTGIDNALPNISYTSPRYESNSSRNPLPDFRQTLYWNIIKVLNEKQNFEFYTSDWTGDYIVEVKGTDSSGNRVNAYKIINISK